MDNKITTVVNFILDESGSMGAIRSSVIDGFNEYINGLKQNKEAEMLFTLTKFDSNGLRTPYVLAPIQEVQPLSNETYQPGANTPLYDAVVETVEKLSATPQDKRAFVVVIMTDGQENSSRKHNEQCMKDIIHKLQHKGNWTFTYMGANQDSWEVAQKYGIERGNIRNWDATSIGTQSAFTAMGAATKDFASDNSRGILRSSSFYAKDESDKK